MGINHFRRQNAKAAAYFIGAWAAENGGVVNPAAFCGGGVMRYNRVYLFFLIS